MLRSVLAVVAGLAVFFVAVSMLQGSMQQVYPPPPGFDPQDFEAVRRHVAGMPAGAFGLLLAVYAVGGFCGGAVAAGIAVDRKLRAAGIVGGLTMLIGIANFAMLPHPLWVVCVGVPLFVVAAVLGGLIGRMLSR